MSILLQSKATHHLASCCDGLLDDEETFLLILVIDAGSSQGPDITTILRLQWWAGRFRGYWQQEPGARCAAEAPAREAAPGALSEPSQVAQC